MAPEATDPYARAVKGLLAAIASGILRPGDPVPVPRFAQDLGLSTTPVREALAHLSGAGLLVRHHRHGYAVPALTASDLIDLFALEAALLFGTTADNPLASALLALIDLRLAPLMVLLKQREESGLLDRPTERPSDWAILTARRDRLAARAEPFARALRETNVRSEL